LCSPFLRYTVPVPNARTCVVSFRDQEGLEHSVVVTASSLYEAAARGLKAFRESPFWDGARPGPAARLTVAVKAVEARHEVKLSRLQEWLNSGGRSPREQALKNDLRKMLGWEG
jgi:hypothetical protein